DMGASGTLAAEQRLPIILEIRVIRADGEGLALDVREARIPEQLRKTVRQRERSREAAIANRTRLRVDADGDVPKHALKDEPAAKIPQRGGNGPAGPCDAPQLTQRQLGSRNEYQDKLRCCAGKLPVRARQRAGIADREDGLRFGLPRSRERNERRCKVDADDAPAGPAGRHGKGKRPGAATDVEQVAGTGKFDEIEEASCQSARPSAEPRLVSG